jgi:hypothetical protein
MPLTIDREETIETHSSRTGKNIVKIWDPLTELGPVTMMVIVRRTEVLADAIDALARETTGSVPKR